MFYNNNNSDLEQQGVVSLRTSSMRAVAKQYLDCHSPLKPLAHCCPFRAELWGKATSVSRKIAKSLPR